MLVCISFTQYISRSVVESLASMRDFVRSAPMEVLTLQIDKKGEELLIAYIPTHARNVLCILYCQTTYYIGLCSLTVGG